MKLVDPRKLALLRDAVDLSVTEMVLSTEQTRRACLLELGHEFGYSIEFFKVDDWYLATAQLASAWDEIHLYQDHADFDRCGDVDIASRLDNVAIASSVESAAAALILRFLDEKADIFFTEEEAADFYPATSIADHEGRIGAVENYIRQERWFGDVPQCGRAEEIHGIVASDDGEIWCDGYGKPV